ncbi:hypothetical protein N7507_003347 [Penicillium longicatenatum]|nr:hypothetical protein N7507_003347 [Penicillium longicatenatum]
MAEVVGSLSAIMSLATSLQSRDKVIRELRQEIEALQASTGERSSKRDWLRIRYIGEDITGFKDILASYKSTISLALAHNEDHKRISGINAAELQLIEEEKDSTQKSLKFFATKLISIPRLKNKPESEEQNFREELSGTESLLNFCKQVEEEAKQQRTHFFEDVSTAIITTFEDLISAKRIKSGNNSYQALGRMADESIQSFFNGALPNDESSGQVDQERE